MYKSALFHLHSILEGSQASISGYCHEAKEFGVEIVWISDHDSRFFREGAYKVPLDGECDLRPISGPALLSVRKPNGNGAPLAVRVAGNGEKWGGVVRGLPGIWSI